MECKVLLERICKKFEEINRENLVGFYVHGSIAFGCFNPECSDIDFLVVTKEEASLDQKKEMLKCMHEYEADCCKKGFEMSIVLEEHCENFVYPTPYNFHYATELREESEKDFKAYCDRYRGADIDLAAHFTVIKAVGITLYGKAIEDLFGEVDSKCYLDSIRLDVEDAKEHIHINPMYVILNLSRILAYIKEGLVISKEQGGRWGVKNLPDYYAGIAQKALDKYVIGSGLEFTEKELADFADYLTFCIFNNQTKSTL